MYAIQLNFVSLKKMYRIKTRGPSSPHTIRKIHKKIFEGLNYSQYDVALSAVRVTELLTTLYFVLKLTNDKHRLIHSSFQKFVYLNLVPISIYTSDLKIFNVLSVAPLIIIEGFDQSAHRILPSCPVMSYKGALGLKRKIIFH